MIKNILVSGSNGFLGSYFVNNYNKKYNIKTFSFLNDDFKDLDLSDADAVVNLSALVHQMGGANVSEYERVNVTQTIDLAKKAKKDGVKHFVFMSTVKVYGEETDVAYTEKSICNPQDEYGKSKLKAERELEKLEDENFIVSIIRTPIVYGYGVKANIANLISLVSKVPILPFGNIQNRRSMVYIGNLCHLVDLVIGAANAAHPEGEVNGAAKATHPNNVFLACDDEPLSTTRLIELITQNLDKKIYLIKIPLFENLLKLLKPSFHKRLYGSLEVDNTITKEKLNLKNLYSVKEGIRLMIDSNV